MRSRAAALAWFRAPRHGFGGMCLAWTRTGWGLAARYPSAISSWRNTPSKYRHTSRSIPIGAPVYFSKRGHPYGHVAVYMGGGKMATTHASTNRTGIDRMALWESNGWRYLGWTSWLNGHHLPLSGGSGGGSSTLRRGSTGAKVTALQKRLNHDYFSYSDLDVDGKFGPATERVVREFQRRAGLHVDGIVGPATRGALGL